MKIIVDLRASDAVILTVADIIPALPNSKPRSNLVSLPWKY
jgi:hypothetical protein